MFKKLVLLLLVYLIIFTGCKTIDDDYKYKKNDPPAEYVDDEFQDWLYKLRRSEVILTGAFPVVMLFTELGALIYTSASKKEIEDDYAKLKIGLSISASVSLIDFILGFFIEDNNE